MTELPSARARAWLTTSAFFWSGAAGLIYQVAWQRILALHSGVGIYSVAMIVAAFMAGLGIGSAAGGRLSARVSATRALRLFIGVEMGIAAFGVLSGPLYYDLLYTRMAWLYAAPWRAGLLHFAALLLPTTLMGMSLPFLCRAMVRETETAGGTIGRLYAINLVGAGAGALATPWLLIRHFGIRGALLAAAALNLVAVILAALAALAAVPETEGEDSDPRRGFNVPTLDAARPFGFWMALYALSGFCALSLEIVWFRLLDLALRSRAFTFGTLLSVYLLGSALGCLAAATRVRRLARPVRAFLICQCLLLLYSGAIMLATAWIPTGAPVYRWLFQYWSAGNGLTPLDAPLRQVLGLYIGVPLVLFGPPTILMGFSFPILQRAVQDDPQTSGRKVGALQAANIAGCVAGSLLVGLLTLQAFGSTGTLRGLMAVGAIFAAIGIGAYGARSVFLPMAAALLLLAAGLPSQQQLWSRLHGTADPSALVLEDATGVGALVPRGAQWAVYVDGKHHSWLPFGGVHTVLGALPALVHPAPIDVAVIGLGSGDTAWAAGCRPETRRVTVFEISGPQPRLLALLASAYAMPDLRSFLHDPRLDLRIADGRHALTQQDRLYDMIEADALWPDVAYSGNLYSTEFFAQCARRLKPGGILCTWAPTPRIYDSFASVMPHVLGSHKRRILIGSQEPLAIAVDTWLARLRSPAVTGYLSAERAEEIARMLSTFRSWDRAAPADEPQLNHDLFPRDEFLTPSSE